MSSILNILTDTSNQTMIITCMCLAAFRIYLELIKFDFDALPMSKALKRQKGAAGLKQFHRTGLYLSIGYVVLFAPSLLLT